MLKSATEVISTDTRGFSATLRASAWLMTLAWAAAVTGGMLVCISAVHALAALVPQVPLWACYGLVGLPALVLGGVMLLIVRGRLASLQPLDAHATEVAGEMIQIAGRVNDVLETATDSIRKASGAVRQHMETVRTATDVRHHVEAHPWVMFAGAAGLGYLSGSIFVDKRPSITPPNGSLARRSNVILAPGTEFAQRAPDTEAPDREPGILDKLGEVIAPQADLLRQIAIGSLFSFVRDVARDAMPTPMEQPVDDFFNDAAKKFGGRPLARRTFEAPVVKAPTDGVHPVT
jgi:ElaB/YqjD/DUF883 family membrane-anchored ribosome-binding protein